MKPRTFHLQNVFAHLVTECLKELRVRELYSVIPVENHLRSESFDAGDFRSLSADSRSAGEQHSVSNIERGAGQKTFSERNLVQYCPPNACLGSPNVPLVLPLMQGKYHCKY